MKTLDRSIKADAFVCQLSTNDATQEKPLGRIADGFDIDSFQVCEPSLNDIFVEYTEAGI